MGYKKDMSKYENLEGWERCGFGEQLDRWAEKYGERTAVTDSEDEISYMELKQKADCLAAAFLRKGILKGDKVLVQLPNRISFVIVFFALSKIGAVPIMMLPAHREAELEGIIELAKPAAYIVVEKYLGFSYVPMANAMKEKYSCIRHIFIDSESGDISGMIAETCGENGAFPAVDGYETAVLLLSGGTTGVPKLIPRTHTDYMYNARMSAKRCRLDSSDVYLASLPVAHNFPLCCPGLLGTLDVGGKVVLASATSPDDILDAITEEGVTITALVPAMVTVCMEMLEWDEDYDISSLRILQVGGAMLEDSLADKIIEEWPCKLMQVFGTAEGLLSFTSPEDEGSLIARCQGTPVSPADEVKIVDEEDKAVPEGVFGELLSRGPYTIDGYYMAEEANKKSFTPDGFYRTGDKAMWTKDGRLRLGGRIKEQINRAGEKIMPFNDDLIEMIIGGVYNFSKAAAIDYVEEIKSYKAGIPMACVRNGKILPAQKRSPLNLPTRISKLSILPYVTEEIQEIIQGKYMLNIDSYTAAPVSLFSIVNKAHCQKKDLVNALMGQKNSNQKAFIWVRQNKGNDSRCIYFEGKNPSVLTGEILAITANAIFEMPRKDGIYTMASYLEKYQVLDELKKIDKFKSEGKI